MDGGAFCREKFSIFLHQAEDDSNSFPSTGNNGANWRKVIISHLFDPHLFDPDPDLPALLVILYTNMAFRLILSHRVKKFASRPFQSVQFTAPEFTSHSKTLGRVCNLCTWRCLTNIARLSLQNLAPFREPTPDHLPHPSLTRKGDVSRTRDQPVVGRRPLIIAARMESGFSTRSPVSANRGTNQISTAPNASVSSI